MLGYNINEAIFNINLEPKKVWRASFFLSLLLFPTYQGWVIAKPQAVAQMSLGVEALVYFSWQDDTEEGNALTLNYNVSCHFKNRKEKCLQSVANIINFKTLNSGSYTFIATGLCI